MTAPAIAGPGMHGRTTVNAPSWVYRAYDETGALLYIGTTTNLKKRVGIHRSQSSWWRLVAEVTAEGPFDRTDALRREREAIWTEGPLCNRPPRMTVLDRAVSPRVARPAPALPVGRTGAHQP